MSAEPTTASTGDTGIGLLGGLPLSMLLLIFMPFASDVAGEKTPDAIPRQQRLAPSLQPFLEVFTTNTEPPVTMHPLSWPGVVGEKTGLLARQETDERLPGLLLIADRSGLDDWHQRTARELAEVGYVVLAVEVPGTTIDERGLADISAAVRWLRRRGDVYPDRIGTIGWQSGGEWALAVAAANGLEAVVCCDGGVSLDPAVLAGLRHTAVMGLWSGEAAREERTERIAEFQHALESAGIAHDLLLFDDAERGFMRPGHPTAHRFDDAERAWFEIYEFLGEHVEDAAIKRLLAAKETAQSTDPANFATIADLMRAVNAPTGVRGQLAELLREAPADEKAWTEARALAAVLVETAGLLERRTPPHGSTSSWLEHIESYRAAAKAIHSAAGERERPAALAGLDRLTQSCSACHLEHR